MSRRQRMLRTGRRTERIHDIRSLAGPGRSPSPFTSVDRIHIQLNESAPKHKIFVNEIRDIWPIVITSAERVDPSDFL